MNEIKETFRFPDEYDKEIEIFTKLSGASTWWAGFILVGKRKSRRHSTTGFSENGVVAGTRHQLLEGSEEGLTSLTKSNNVNFSGGIRRNEVFRAKYISFS